MKRETMKMMTKPNIFYLVLLALIIVCLLFTLKLVEKKNYHCHAKNFHLYESIEKGGSVYLKTKKECIDIHQISKGEA